MNVIAIVLFFNRSGKRIFEYSGYGYEQLLREYCLSKTQVGYLCEFIKA